MSDAPLPPDYAPQFADGETEEGKDGSYWVSQAGKWVPDPDGKRFADAGYTITPDHLWRDKPELWVSITGSIADLLDNFTKGNKMYPAVANFTGAPILTGVGWLTTIASWLVTSHVVNPENFGAFWTLIGLQLGPAILGSISKIGHPAVAPK